MPLLQLIGRLGLDTSNYEANLKKSEMSVAAFGKKFQRSIVSTVGSFFTLGYAVNFVQDKIRALEGDGESLEIPTGQLSEDIIAQQERIAGLEKELALKKDMAKLDAEIFKLADERFMKELSNEDKLIELKRRRAAILEILRDNFEMGVPGIPPLKAKEMQLETEKLLNQILAIEGDQDKPKAAQFRRMNIGEKALDPLARIGGFTGGADARIVTIQERIAKATEETADNTSGNSVRFR